MTEKQQRFVNAKLKGENNTESARQAGYRGNAVTLGAVGYENLKKPQIKEALDDKRAELSLKVENKAEDILKETMRIAYAPNSPIVSTGDKLRALEMCGKAIPGGLWTDKHLTSKEPIKPLTAEEEEIAEAEVRALKRHKALGLAKETA